MLSKLERSRACPGGADFVRSAYHGLLGREADEEEIAAALAKLAQGLSREALLLMLARSSEFAARMETARSAFRQDDDVINDRLFMKIYEQCKGFTMTSIYSMYALFNAVRHVARHDIPGDFVECGVWQGGSAMLAAMTFLACNASHRKLYLYDTFAGMTQPSSPDVRHDGTSAEGIWSERRTDAGSSWACADLEDVRRNMAATSYPGQNILIIQGKVEDTIPATVPESIAVLRLDTDWYESTRHELRHLYPRVAKGGSLIVDDYGWWKGCRRAVDEYFDQCRTPVLLNRICPSGARLGVKPSA